MSRLFKALSEMESGQSLPKGLRRGPAPKVVLNFGVLTAVFDPPKAEQEAEQEPEQQKVYAPKQAETVPAEMPSSDNSSPAAELGDGGKNESHDAVFPEDSSPDAFPNGSEQEMEKDRTSTMSVLAEESSSGIARPNREQELAAMNSWLESVLADEPSTGIARPIQDQETAPSDSWLEAILADDSSAGIAQPLQKEETKTNDPSSEDIFAAQTSPDVKQVIQEQEVEPKDLWFDAYIDELRGYADAALERMLSTEIEAQPHEHETDVKQASLDAVLADAPSTDEAPVKPEQEAAEEQTSTAIILANSSSVAAPISIPEQEVKPEETRAETVLSDLPSPAVVAVVPPAPVDEGKVPAQTTPEPQTAKDSAPKSAASGMPRSISFKVTPESRLVAITDPNSLGAEKFRALATRLELLREQSELKSFQVTSSVIHEGKSLVSGNAALTLAKYFGAKTLLIEGDLHRPTLAALLGLSNLRGLSHWWYGRDEDLDQYVQKLDHLPLWFLPAGKATDRPSDILRSPRFVKAFQKMASQFDWIVVDSTPMMPIVDVNVWSRLVDGTLLVVREGVTPVKALEEGLRSLDNPKLIGVVLNEATASNELKYAGEYYGSPKHRQMT